MARAPDNDRILALVGVFQASALVRQCARHENCEHRALHASSFSLLRLNADSTEEVFGSIRGLRLGLDCMVKLFGGSADSSAREIFQYAAGMYHISLKLRNHRALQTMIEHGFEELGERYLNNDPCRDNGYGYDYNHDQPLHADIAALYARSISTLTPRIMVHGARGKLENPLTINRVRTALFSGIRAAWLWHQLGGRRWQVLFQRKHYQRQAQILLRQPAAP